MEGSKEAKEHILYLQETWLWGGDELGVGYIDIRG